VQDLVRHKRLPDYLVRRALHEPRLKTLPQVG
jgi:hypothetical protein